MNILGKRLMAIGAGSDRDEQPLNNNNNNNAEDANDQQYTEATETETETEDYTGDDGTSDEVNEDGEDDDDEEEEVSWVTWFCELDGHEILCHVDDDFIDDDFNLTGLNAIIPCYNEALEMIKDIEPDESMTKAMMEEVEGYAELLYLLIHQRFILTTTGMTAVYEKYAKETYGKCPRVYCRGQQCLPVGSSNFLKHGPVQLFCPRCSDVYDAQVQKYQQVDGAAFGNVCAHLLIYAFPDMHTELKQFWKGMAVDFLPPDDDEEYDEDEPWWYRYADIRPSESYIMKIFGFRLHPSSFSGPQMRWLRQRRRLDDDSDYETSDPEDNMQLGSENKTYNNSEEVQGEDASMDQRHSQQRSLDGNTNG